MDSTGSTLGESRMALTMHKFINQLNKKYGTIQECVWDDEIDAVLIPDNFLDEERIQEVLDACTQEAWEHVHKNRFNYSPRIRRLIEPKDSRMKTKMVVRDMTDADFVRIEMEKRAENMKKFEVHWQEMKKNVSDRPADDLDDDYDDAWQALSAARDRMTAYLAKKKSKYVPPSARKTSDPEQEAIEKDIAECQEEFDSLEKRIREEDEKYLEQKKNEFFEIWMLQMQAQIDDECGV